jgi:acetyl-CoA carboxylase biotin carboxyl carrier protein
MELNHTAMKALLDAFDRSDWQEMTVTVGDDRLHVSRQAASVGAPPPPAPQAAAADTAAPAAPEPALSDPVPTSPPVGTSTPHAPAPAPPPAAPQSGAPGAGTVVESPSVGLFWRAPSPAEPPFVEVGGRVQAGDTVAIVEVMKLMNHVTAPVSGVVTSILADNGATVEYGQPLLTVDPEG